MFLLVFLIKWPLKDEASRETVNVSSVNERKLLSDAYIFLQEGEKGGRGSEKNKSIISEEREIFDDRGKPLVGVYRATKDIADIGGDMKGAPWLIFAGWVIGLQPLAGTPCLLI